LLESALTRDTGPDGMVKTPKVVFPDPCSLGSGLHCGSPAPAGYSVENDIALREIIAVFVLDGYRLKIRFDDGVEGKLDIADIVPLTGVFEPLKVRREFSGVRVHPELGTIYWPSGADLDPDVLYSRMDIVVPLRDHFHPPVSKKASWEGFHGMWLASIAPWKRTRSLTPGLPATTATAALTAWAATDPAVAVETDPPDEYEYEVRIFDVERERTLVAAIELVSPANRDRPESRQAFVAKCAALLRKGIALSLVDLVTIRGFSLYAQLMQFIGHPDQTMSSRSHRSTQPRAGG
jgi:hypothetical protein